jgi:rhodanese-related sulfurtransferase
VEFVRNNLLMIAVALVSGAMLIWPLLRRSFGGPSVTAAQATQLINREDALVVDVREPGEYGSGHILGAKNVPLARVQAAGGAELAKRKEKALILYCDSGDRAQKAAAVLRKLGFGKVVSLSGGLPAWQQAGLPVEK